MRGEPDDDTVVLPLVGDRPTAVAPLAPARTGETPGVPEVPALADLAGPGRPPVDAVVDDAPEDDTGTRPRRPSRSMRARADEMARLLERAAPQPGSRRRLSSLPAAVAVVGAFAVGGVGLALGLDAERTGQDLALPPMPALPAEQAPASPGDPGSAPDADTQAPVAPGADDPADVGLTAGRAPAGRAPVDAASAGTRAAVPEVGAVATPEPTTGPATAPTTGPTPRSATTTSPTTPTTDASETPETSPRSVTDAPADRSDDTSDDGDTAGGSSALR